MSVAMSSAPVSPPATGRRLFLLGGTGTIGRATLRELLGRGHEVVALLRPGAALPPARGGLVWRTGDLADPAAVARDGLRGERFDAVVSCLASRTGAPADAWAIDHAAHRQALQAALAAGVPQWLQLSAICVQKPRLAFQHAKLAFEAELMASPLDWTIVRPTAFFKSLSGQVERVRQGKPFLMFGDGRLTACKPIADEDLATYLADRLADPDSRRRVLPIGGPGDAITPRQQGERLFELLGRPPRFKSVPPGLLAGIAGALGSAARLWPPLQAKAEFARIGHYYATESMLVWDAATGRYDAAATPSTGTRTLFDHHAALLRGDVAHERGEHAVF
jgi:divinyl chlorophyllide a 8-vinyl-reductase